MRTAHLTIGVFLLAAAATRGASWRDAPRETKGPGGVAQLFPPPPARSKRSAGNHLGHRRPALSHRYRSHSSFAKTGKLAGIAPERAIVRVGWEAPGSPAPALFR